MFIENPDVVFALVFVVLIEPSVLAEPEPFAFQFHETKSWVFPLTLALLPTEKPSLLKELKSLASVSSAAFSFDSNFLVAPLTASVRTLLLSPSLFLIHTQSGCKSVSPSKVIDCVPPFPV